MTMQKEELRGVIKITHKLILSIVNVQKTINDVVYDVKGKL
jgi:hypothetical protein